MHRISALLYADDTAMRQLGTAQLKSALDRAGSVRHAAKELGVSERQIHRWIVKAGLRPPDGREKPITSAELKAALRQAPSAVGAAKLLGVSHRTVPNLARRFGVTVPDGRKTRHES